MFKIDSAKNVLNRIIRSYDLKTAKQYCSRVGVSASGLSSRIARNTDMADLILRSNYETGASIDWLTTGDGEMFVDMELHDKNAVYIERLDVTASAGTGVTNSEIKEVIELIKYNKQEAQVLFGTSLIEHLKIINIKGDSMCNTFEPGDLIFVDVSKSSFDSDGIYVFTFDDCLFVKRLQRIKNVLRVKSDNPIYDPWDIEKHDAELLTIHGKVMMSQSSLLRKHG